MIAASCLEIWAMRQPGGDTLHLRIKVGSKLEVKSKVSAQVEVEELLYGRQGEHLYGRPVLGPELGRCKAIKLTFNDPNTTQARSTFTCCSRNKGVRAWVASIEIVHTRR